MFSRLSGLISASMKASSSTILAVISGGSSKSMSRLPGVSSDYANRSYAGVRNASSRLQRDAAIRVCAADAAVDQQQLPVDIRGIVAGQKCRGGRDLVGAAGALHRRDMAELAFDA